MNPQKIIFSLLMVLSLSLTADLSLAGGGGGKFFGSSFWDRVRDWARVNFAATAIRKDDSLPTCGNGRLDRGEECDDGNVVGGDGCDAQCLNESRCGNGILERGEECDDGNTVNRDGCNALCKLEPAPPRCAGITESATVFNVNSVEDIVDATPGDGSCATAARTCTLRAAVMESNELEGDSVIMIPAGTYNLILNGWGRDNHSVGDLDVTDDVVLCGEGAQTTIIDALYNFAVIDVHEGIQARIENLALTRGGTSPDTMGEICSGQGLFTRPASNVTISQSIIRENGNSFGWSNCSFVGVRALETALTVTNSAIVSNGNRNLSGWGGGIEINGGFLNMRDSSVVSNYNTGNGGGISIHCLPFLPSRSVNSFTITNSTISGNTSLEHHGGAIYMEATSLRSGDPCDLTLLNSTVTDNFSGNYGNVSFEVSRRMGIRFNVRIINSIIGANHITLPVVPRLAASWTECAVIGSNNPTFIVENSLIGPGNCPGYEPLPGDFSYFLGGLVDSPISGRAYVPLLGGSPAINAGNPATCTETDQLGRPRVGACDIGAVEFRP